MATKFYSKELANNPFLLPDGKQVPFETFPSNVGVIALDTEKDAAMIAALDDAISKRKGGIVGLDEAGYEELKKNRGGSRLSAAFQQPPKLQAMRSPTVFRSPVPQPAPANHAAAADTNGHAAAPQAPASNTPKLDGPAKTPRPSSKKRSEAEKAPPKT